MAKTMWAVGTDDGEDWKPIDAPSAEEAKARYSAEYGQPIRYLDATRVEAWDGLVEVTKIDWITAGNGLTYPCDGCGEMTNRDFGAEVVNGEIICGHCEADFEEE